MSRRTRTGLGAAAVAGITTAGILFGAGTASAHEGHDHGGDGSSQSGTSRGKGVPTAGPDFFLNHLDTYHFGKPYIGFHHAVSDPYGWAVYHFTPTFLETGARAVSPKDAPAVDGDTWVDKTAPVSHGTSSGPPSHDGDDLRAPISPLAGAKYLNLWAQQSAEAPGPQVLAQAVPAIQEAIRRTITPTEQAPPVKNDRWTDKRPVDESGAAVVVPGKAIAPVAQGSKQVGSVPGHVLDEISGDSSGHHAAPSDTAEKPAVTGHDHAAPTTTSHDAKPTTPSKPAAPALPGPLGSGVPDVGGLLGQ